MAAAKKAAKKQATRRVRTRTVTVTVPELDEDEDQGEDVAKGIPLFEGLGEEVQIQVYRVEPIEEGSIGHLSSDADEATIRRRWGGGVYRLSAKGTDGKFGKMQRTVTIGGDPKFEGEDATRKYAIKMGKLPPEPAKPAAAPAAPAFGDVAGLMAAMIQASQAQQTALMQAQIKASDDARARDQQFFQTILTLKADKHAPAAPAADPGAMVPLMLKFLQLGRDMAGNGAEAPDPVTAFITNLPQILPQAQAMLAAAGSANQQGAPPALAPVPPPAAPPGQGQARKITLSGPIAEQLMKTAAELQRRGFDPEKSVELALKQLADGLAELPVKADAAAPTEKAKPAPPAPAAAGGNGTSPPARATRKK